ncbi:hypothetical protein AB4114_22220 [Paenibacillus sp. 2RAB27]|uniref:hypothetical protein n=1 Tax=Paenibacillus sp. 2RAB27 TaxID=3232991 RepID=UPI003F96E592
MLLFKDLELEVQVVKDRLGTLGEAGDRQLDKQRLDLLLLVVTFVNGMTWLSHEKTIVKVQFFLKNGYDYRLAARHFGVTVKSLHVTISYAATRLRGYIGANTLEWIRDGRIEEAGRAFSIASGQVQLSDLLVQSVVERIKPKQDASVDLSHCEFELKFLLQYSSRLLERRLEVADLSCLQHLMYILLSNDSSFDFERGILQRLLMGELNPEGAIRAIKRDSIYSG